jgi:hypothetical protein
MMAPITTLKRKERSQTEIGNRLIDTVSLPNTLLVFQKTFQGRKGFAMIGRVSGWKYVRIGKEWRYCKPAVGKNGKIILKE